jgi:hypothetical protein
MDLLTLNIEKTIFNYSIYRNEVSILSNRINYSELIGKDMDAKLKELIKEINNCLADLSI